MSGTEVTAWTGERAPSRAALEDTFRAEGLSPSWWSNGPSDVYGAHSHPYDKVLYCAEGSITFRLDESGKELEIRSGDRLDIPPGTVHSARVGHAGVVCGEAARRPPSA